MNRRFNNIILASLVAVAFSVSATAKDRTVGDLLKDIEKQSRLKRKQRNSLPRFTQVSKRSGKRASKVNLRKIKPPSTSQLYYKKGTNEGELEKITDQAISQLYRLTRQNKKSPNRGELWLRLAEQYVEKARLIELKIQNEFDRRVELYNSGKIKRRPRINLSASRAYNKKAIQLYEWFIRDFPRDKKMDQALFFLGYNHFELGNLKKGEANYKRLSRSYPKSPYVTEANFSLGDYYFENQKWADAKKYFRLVTKRKSHRLYSFALYKGAWSNYKLGRYKDALKGLERVILDGRRSKGRNEKGSNRIRLANEAMKDLVAFYAEAGDPKKARSYFRRVAGKKTAPILFGRLGYYYADKGDRVGARKIFMQLINENPTAPKAFDYQYKIVNLYAGGGGSKTFQRELFRWVERYGAGSDWQEANKFNKNLIAKSRDLSEATLRNYTLQTHQAAQNSRAKFSQSTARKSYELYFANFNKSKKIDEMRFFYAELLYDMKEYEDAATNYMVIVRKHKDSKYFKQAMLNALLSIEKKLPSIEEVKKITKQGLEPVEFSTPIKKFERIAKNYFAEVPSGKSRAEVKYRLAALYYYHNQFDKAIPAFNEIIAEYPKTKYAEYAANLLLDTYNLKKDYKGLEVAAERILAVPGLKRTSIGKQVKSIKTRSTFKRAEVLEGEKKYPEAAAAFESFASGNIKSALAFQAFYNAGINYEKSNNLDKAAEMYGKVLSYNRPPSPQLRKNSNRFRALILQKTGQYEKAAEAFEKYAANYPKEKDTLDFIYNAAVIRKAMRYYTASLNGFQKFLDKSKSKDRFETLFLMGEMWEKRGKSRRAIGFYDKYVNSPSQNKAGLIEASFRVAKLYEKVGNTKQADRWHNRTIAIQKNLAKSKTGIGSRYAASSKFYLVNKTYKDLRNVRIPQNSAKQSQAVQKKLGLLNKLKSELKQVIDYDDPANISASLSLQAQALEHLSKSIYEAPIPKGLNPDEIKIYKAEIDKLASPLRKQAIENYKAALERSHSLDGYGPWVNIARAELKRLEPASQVGLENEVYALNLLDTSLLDKRSKDDKLRQLKKSFKDRNATLLLENVRKTLAEDENNQEALLALGAYYHRTNKKGLAKLVFERALRENKTDRALINNLAVLLLQDGELDKAIIEFKRAQEGSKSKVAAVNLAGIRVKYGNYSKAEKALDDMYDETKQDLGSEINDASKVAVNYAVSMTFKKKGKSSESVYKRVLSKNESDLKAMVNYAHLLGQSLGKSKEAEKLINKIKFITQNKGILRKVDQLEQQIKKTESGEKGSS